MDTIQEHSIAQALIEGCEEKVKKNKHRKVTEVIIKVGITSGIEPELLKTSFDTLKLKTVCHDTFLTINLQDIKVRCEKCGHELEIMKFIHTCPLCGSQDIKIIDGYDMQLLQVITK